MFQLRIRLPPKTGFGIRVPVLAGLVLVLVPVMLRIFRPPTQLFMFVLLLQHAVPTAINMSVRGSPWIVTNPLVKQGWAKRRAPAASNLACRRLHQSVHSCGAKQDGALMMQASRSLRLGLSACSCASRWEGGPLDSSRPMA